MEKTSKPFHLGQRVALVIVLGAIALLSVRQVGSLDVGFQLQGGRHVLSSGWPDNDTFTYTVNDRPYVDTSWGYQVLLVTVQRLAGAPGMVLLHTGFVLAIFVLLLLTARLGPAEPSSLVGLVLLGGLAAEMRYEVRPELLSYTLLAGVLYLAHRYVANRETPLWPLPLIFLVWANCHSLFILGWAALGCVLAALLLAERRIDLRLAGWTASAVAVTLVNPYGYKALVFPFTLATRLREGNVFNQSIGEFVSPFTALFGSSAQFPFVPWPALFSFMVFAALVVLSLPRLLADKRYVPVLVALPFVFLSFKMIRNVPLLVVAGLPCAAWGLPAMRRAGPGLRRGALIAVSLVALLVGLRVVTDAHYVETRRPERFGLGWNRGTQPVAAAEYARHAGLDGPVLNHLNYGGYLMWARDAPVFIDGRLEVIGERFYEAYRQVLAGKPAMEAAVARFGIRWAIFPYRTNPQLLGRLSGDREWRLVYVDDQAVIFARSDLDGVRQHESVARVLAQSGGGVPPIDGLPGLGGGPRRGRLSRLVSGTMSRRRFPDEPFAHGLFHLYRGDYAAAAGRFAEAVEVSGGVYYEMYNNLGSALYRLGRRDEAVRCYEIVLEDVPDNETARRRLAEIGTPRR